MAEFNFGKKVVICDHTFLLDPGNPEYHAKADQFSERIRRASKEPKEEGMEHLIEVYHEIFDLLLGDGAFTTIFENRDPNAFDLVSVMNYLTEEMGGNPKKDEPAKEDTKSENRILLDEILDGMDDAQLTQLTMIAKVLNK